MKTKLNNINLEIEEKINIKDLNFILNKIEKLNISKIGNYYITTNKYVLKNLDLKEKLKGISVKTKSVIENGKKTYSIVIKGKNKGTDKLRIRDENEKVIDSIVDSKNLLSKYMNIDKEYFKKRDSFLYLLPSGNNVRLDLDQYDDEYSKDIILEIEGSVNDIKEMKKILEIDESLNTYNDEDFIKNFNNFENNKIFKIKPSHIELIRKGETIKLFKSDNSELYLSFLNKYIKYKEIFIKQNKNKIKKLKLKEKNTNSLLKELRFLNSPYEQTSLI